MNALPIKCYQKKRKKKLDNVQVNMLKALYIPIKGWRIKEKWFVIFKKDLFFLNVKGLKTKNIKGQLFLIILLYRWKIRDLESLWPCGKTNEMYARFSYCKSMKTRSLKTKLLAFSFQRCIAGIWLQMNECDDQMSSFICAFLTERAHSLWFVNVTVNLKKDYKCQ